MRRNLLSCTSLARHGVSGLVDRAIVAVWARRGRRSRHCGYDFGLARPQSSGIRGSDHRAGAARLFRRRCDPVDAHPHPRRAEPNCGCGSRSPPSGARRPAARAAVRRAAGAGLMGGGRRPAANQRRRRAAGAGGIRRSASLPSEPGCRRNRRCRWTTRSIRCANPARDFCSISPPRPAAPSRPWAAPSAAKPL